MKIYEQLLTYFFEIHTDELQIISSAYGANPDSRMLDRILDAADGNYMIL
jgi:hypothetical protein